MSDLVKTTTRVQSGSGFRAFCCKMTNFSNECILYVKTYTLGFLRNWALDLKKRWVGKGGVNSALTQFSTPVQQKNVDTPLGFNL